MTAGEYLDGQCRLLCQCSTGHLPWGDVTDNPSINDGRRSTLTTAANGRQDFDGVDTEDTITIHVDEVEDPANPAAAEVPATPGDPLAEPGTPMAPRGGFEPHGPVLSATKPATEVVPSS